MNLQTLTALISSQPAARVFDAANAAITAFSASEHASDADKAQAVADGIYSVVKPFLVAEPEVAAVLAVVEPYIGKCVDFVEFAFATPVAAVDHQDDDPVPPPA